jgi:CheY-like chemotaxis protein
MKIALLEDNPVVVELLDATLEMHGYRVKPCASGEALLAALMASPDEQGNGALPFDVLLIDFMLPGEMNGGDVIAAVRQQYPPELLPIILLSDANLADLAAVQAAFPVKALLAAIQQASIGERNKLPKVP